MIFLFGVFKNAALFLVSFDRSKKRTKIAFSKRYLKYLTKKYLKQQELREYIRVVATNKNQYELKFFTVNNDEADAE